MAKTVVCTGGGVSAAVAAATQDRDGEFLFLHINLGQASSHAEFATVERYCATIARAKAIQFDLPVASQLKERLANASGQGEPSPPDQSGTFTHAISWGLMPSILWAGVQCAHGVGASIVITGLSRLTNAPHVGLPLPESHLDPHRPLIHALNITVETLTQRRSALQIEAPLVDLSPAEIIKLGQQLGVNFGDTWSCSAPRRMENHEWATCTRCKACLARELAFAEARITDPATQRRTVTQTSAGA